MSTDDHFLWFGASMQAYPITVTINVLDSNVNSVNSCTVLPQRYSPKCVLKGPKQVAVTLYNNSYYYVEINGKSYGKNHPLFIFADPPLDCQYNNNTPQVLYFNAGYLDIGPNYPVKDGMTVFLEPGAFLEGNIKFSTGYQ